jgi:hypothetical protein
MTLTENAQNFLSHNPTELCSVAGVRFYEHPLRGDNAPIYAVTAAGKLVNTGFWDCGDFDADLVSEMGWDKCALAHQSC